MLTYPAIFHTAVEWKWEIFYHNQYTCYTLAVIDNYIVIDGVRALSRERLTA